jgi:hypothetical protein
MSIRMFCVEEVVSWGRVVTDVGLAVERAHALAYKARREFLKCTGRVMAWLSSQDVGLSAGG